MEDASLTCFEGHHAVSHQLVLAQSDVRAADPGVFVTIVPQVAFPFFGEIELLGADVLGVGVPIAAPPHLRHGALGVFRVSPAKDELKALVSWMSHNEGIAACSLQRNASALMKEE